jgi:hypothetical protein
VISVFDEMVALGEKWLNPDFVPSIRQLAYPEGICAGIGAFLSHTRFTLATDDWQVN